MFNFVDKCKHCGKKFFLGFGFKRHLQKCHNEKITKADKKYIRKCRIKFLLYPFILLAWGVYLLLKLICYPFWAFVEYCWTYEHPFICSGRARAPIMWTYEHMCIWYREKFFNFFSKNYWLLYLFMI